MVAYSFRSYLWYSATRLQMGIVLEPMQWFSVYIYLYMYYIYTVYTILHNYIYIYIHRERDSIVNCWYWHPFYCSREGPRKLQIIIPHVIGIHAWQLRMHSWNRCGNRWTTTLGLFCKQQSHHGFRGELFRDKTYSDTISDGAATALTSFLFH